MSEVSCRAFSYFEACSQQGIVDLDELLEGSALTRATFADPRGRVPWNDWASLCDRFEALVGSEAVEASAAVIVTADFTRPLQRLAQTFVEPSHTYRLAARWFLPLAYPHLETSFRVLDDRRVSFRITIPEPFRPCRTWLLMARGGLRVLPRMTALPDAAVAGRLDDRTLDLTIELPRSRTLTARANLALRTLRVGPDALLDELEQQQDELKAAYQDLRRSEAAIAEKERTHRRLVSAFPDLVVWVKRDSTVIDIHAGANYPFGASLQHLLGRRIVELGPLISGVTPAAFQHALSVLENTLDSQSEHHLELESRTQTGRRLLDARLVPDGPDEAMVFVRDVTDKRLLEERLAIAERLASLGTVAAGVSHELNNPLTFVLTNVGVALELATRLRRGEEVNLDDLELALRDADDGASRMRRIIAELGDYARGGGDEAERVDLAKAIGAAVKITANEIRHRASLEKHIDRGLFITANPGKVTQVFVNLLVNAAHAIPEGAGDEHHITVEAVGKDDVIEVCVSDTGVGMAAEDLGRIFDPFYTTKQKAGTGLGLAISQRIVTELGGSIDVTSRPNLGTTFCVTFPRAPTRRPATGEFSPPRDLEETGEKARVLVIDDEPLVARALRRALRDHEVVIALSGEEALGLLREDQRFDVVLCDLMMPGMSGLDVYEVVTAELPGVAPTFLFMSGGALTPRLNDFIEANAARFMRKPVGPDEVRAFIRLKGVNEG
ncbi:MAG: response regulator [Myxococcales bacterium]|nr:response regulator [Myxococcales bacterium]